MKPSDDVSLLVAAVLDGDEQAWNALVDRYLPLVVAVVRRYRLGVADAEDVNQTLWLRLIENLGALREPRALPQWIVTTTRNEALKLLQFRKRTVPTDYSALGGSFDLVDDSADLVSDVLRREHERGLNSALTEALQVLSADQQRLLLLCASDPRLGYRQISDILHIPIGSIGPTRARCLAKLRECPSMKAFHAAETSDHEEGADNETTRLDEQRR